MEAAEAKLHKILQKDTQFLVPHYQRPYSWQQPQWEALWRDILELFEDPSAEPHFMGSIVTSPARSIPEGVEKRLLIDGQQRLTTLLVVLARLRERAREGGMSRIAERAEDLLRNRHEEGVERYKLLPTQSEDPAESDREAFRKIVDGVIPDTRSAIADAARFFDAKMRRPDAPSPDALYTVITTRLTMVSIVLDEKDNAHRIFESLNGKGRPLTQADLIRNFFFMRLPPNEHERVYADVWRPMQRRLGEEALTDFVRHYLTHFGATVRQSDVYAALKARVDADREEGSPLRHLEELTRFAGYYAILLRPEYAPSAAVKERLERLNRLEVTVAYPFLLGIYDRFACGLLSEGQLCTLLDAIESFVMRRFVCGVPTHGMNKLLAPLYVNAAREPDLVAAALRLLSANRRHYPRDEEFRRHLHIARLYGAGDRRENTKLLLERLEASFAHKETVSTAGLTIEHVLPQTLTEAWRVELGPGYEEDHEQYLHTLGNLTLTSYNAELGNAPFAAKKKRYAESHLELNRYFAAVERWTGDDVEARAEALAEIALRVWPSFDVTDASGVPRPAESGVNIVGSVPSRVRVRGTLVEVESWADVAHAMADAICALGDDVFARVSEELPRFMNRDATAFRRSSRLRKLQNGAYVETNVSATAVYRLCAQVAQAAELRDDEWEITYAAVSPADDEQDGDDAPENGWAQLEFWTLVRDALVLTRAFPSLPTPKAQHYFQVALGRSNTHVALVAGRIVAARVILQSELAAEMLRPLLAERDAIEKELGFPLQWDANPGAVTKTLQASAIFDLKNPQSWPAAVDWFVSRTLALKTAFAPRLARGATPQQRSA